MKRDGGKKQGCTSPLGFLKSGSETIQLPKCSPVTEDKMADVPAPVISVTNIITNILSSALTIIYLEDKKSRSLRNTEKTPVGAKCAYRK